MLQLAPSAVRVYPNPAQGTVQVELPEAQPAQFQLLDVSARLVRMGQLPANGRLSLQGVPAGMYWLTLHAGTEVYRTRLVVRQ